MEDACMKGELMLPLCPQNNLYSNTQEHSVFGAKVNCQLPFSSCGASHRSSLLPGTPQGLLPCVVNFIPLMPSTLLSPAAGSAGPKEWPAWSGDSCAHLPARRWCSLSPGAGPTVLEEGPEAWDPSGQERVAFQLREAAGWCWPV
jgi:hypothetical protein